MIKYRMIALMICVLSYMIFFIYLFDTYVIKAEEIKENIEQIEEEEIIINESEKVEDTNEGILSDTIESISSYEKNDNDGNNVQKNQQDSEEEDLNEGEDMPDNNNQFQIMIIFCFGLLVGVLAGNILTGFIK